MDTISQVAEFEAACGAKLYQITEVPPVEKLKLRLSLELEELYEKAQAMGLERTFCKMLYEKSGAYPMFVDYGRKLLGVDYNRLDDDNIYDPVALLDACCDQRYVQDGTVLTCGLDKAFPEAFAEVQRSNMSKFPKDVFEAQATGLKYRDEGVAVTCSANLMDDNAAYPAVIKRASDGKILKSINYSLANLLPILEKHGYTPTPSGN